MGIASGDCGCSQEQVDLMFRQSEQFVDQEIADRTPTLRRYWVDLFPVKTFPDGVGLSLQKLRFYGDIGPQYDGFDGWRMLQVSRNSTEAALCGEHDACGHVWEDVGHGMETLEYTLMQRDLRTKRICIKDVRTFFQYEQLQNLQFRNLTQISANMREQLNRNAALAFSIKHIALPDLPTAMDPRQFPVIPPGVEVGKATYGLLESLYHPFIQEASGFEISTVDGMPAIGVIASPQTLRDMILSDPEIRTDLRYMKVDLVTRYNLMDGMGPFIFMPDLAAPRFNRDAAGNLIRVFPWNRTMPIEVGTRPITNADYHNAEFEYIQFMTRDLFALRSRRPITTVGGETSFDATPISPFQWKWISNPPTEEAPWRNKGRYVTTAEVGIEPGDFTDVWGVLVKRRPGFASIQYWGPEICPPDPVVCDNVLPEQDCPCPIVLNVFPTGSPLEFWFVFSRAPGGVVDDALQLEEVNGASLEGNIEEIGADPTWVRLSFLTAPCTEPGRYVGVYCNDLASCSANVLKTEVCGILASTVKMVLDKPLKAATAAQVVKLFMCDGSTIDVPIVSANPNTMEWTVTLAFATYCARKGIVGVCVPTATVAGCPTCTPSMFTACVDPA